MRSLLIEMYRKLFGVPAEALPKDAGLPALLDGDGAVAITEACIAQDGVLAEDFFSAGQGLAWRAEQSRQGANLFGEPLSSSQALDARGAVAQAIGLTLGGRRAALFLSAPDLLSAQDLLIQARVKRLPLVIQVNNRTLPALGISQATSHQAMSLLAHTGCIQLLAENAQQAVDFTLIARHLAESALQPVLLFKDGAETADAAQSLSLVSPAIIQEYLGRADDGLPVEGMAEKLLWGDERRRVPCWHDLDHPVAQGMLYQDQALGLGQVALDTLFKADVAKLFRASCQAFARLTGRDYQALSGSAKPKASHVLLVLGSARALASAAAQDVKSVEVRGLHLLNPLPQAELADLMRNRQRLLVLEREPQGGGLASRLQGENRGQTPISSLEKSGSVPYFPLHYGFDGLPLRLADMSALMQQPDTQATYLGVRLDVRSEHPKRQAMLDALKRDHPELAQLSLYGEDDGGLKGSGFCLALEDNPALLLELAELLHHALGNCLLVQGNRLSWNADAMPVLTADSALDLAWSARATAAVSLELPDTEAKEMVLGSILAALLASEKLPVAARKLVSSRERQLRESNPEQMDALLEVFERALSGRVEPQMVEAGSASADVPLLLRHLAAQAEGYDSLPRFWDQTGILYAEGQSEQLSPDPFLATGTVPPLTSSFNALGAQLRWLPQVVEGLCTGCGQCWTACPDGAIGTLLASPTSLINGAVAQGGLDALRPLANKLGGRISQRARKKEFSSASFAELLDESSAWLQQKSPLSGDRQQAVSEALAKLSARTGSLELQRVDALLQIGERAATDGGELLALAFNPDACKSCGLCVSVCPEQALQHKEPELAADRLAWQAWASTKDTDSVSIQRLIEHNAMPPLAAQMLSRHALLALASGDKAEPGSGEKIAVRLLLAATEYQMQPKLARFAATLEQARKQVQDQVEQALVSALPATDLQQLSGLLAQGSARQMEVSKLIPAQGAAVDRTKLSELTALGLQLADEQQRILKGAQGLGRTRYGLVLAPGSLLDWAAQFPDNPFQAPVTVALDGQAAETSAGLMQAQMQTLLDALRLLHQARIATGAQQLGGKNPQRLTWADLDDEEKSLLPPLWLIGNEQSLGGAEFAAINRLLNSGLPIRILSLAELDFGLDAQGLSGKPLAAQHDSTASLGMMALAQRSAFVAQCAISQTSHLWQVLRDAYSFPGATLIRVHVPSPQRHGLASDVAVQSAQLAVDSRAFPLFSYDPRRAGVYGLRIQLAGNAEPNALLQQVDGHSLTPAHWAFSEGRFANHFEPLADGDAAPALLTDWMALDAKGKSKKTPIISLVGDDGSKQVLKLSPAMAEMAARQIHQWQVMQELAGLVTPFTEQVRAQALQDLAASHQADMAEAQAQAEQRLEATQNGLEAEVAARIKSRLMALAGYDE